MVDLRGIFRAGITRGEWGHLRFYGSSTPRHAATRICANENEQLHGLPPQGTPGPRQALLGGHATDRARLNGPGSSIRLRSRQWHSNVLSKRYILSLGRFVLPGKKRSTQTDGYGRKARGPDDFRQPETIGSPARLLRSSRAAGGSLCEEAFLQPAVLRYGKGLPSGYLAVLGIWSLLSTL